MKNRAEIVAPPIGSHAGLARLQAVFDALSHPVRRQILLGLGFRKAMFAGEIASHYPVAWPTISRHLKVLVKAELIRVRKRGRQVSYSVNRRQLMIIWDEWLRHFEQK